MLEFWDVGVQQIGCLECRMFRRWKISDARCLGCEIIRKKHI